MILTRLLLACALLAFTCVGFFAVARRFAETSSRARRRVMVGGWIGIGATAVLAVGLPYLLLHGTDNSGAILIIYGFLFLGAGLTLLLLSAIAGAFIAKPPAQ
jgi:hypothetical protein